MVRLCHRIRTSILRDRGSGIAFLWFRRAVPLSRLPPVGRMISSVDAARLEPTGR